jgi:exonuclease VII small subunit
MIEKLEKLTEKMDNATHKLEVANAFFVAGWATIRFINHRRSKND